MKRSLLAIAFISCFSFISFGQSADEDIFYFNFMEDKLDDSQVNEEYLSKHPFGIEVAKKLELLKDSYTWREEGTATMPVERTVVEKPAIYYSIKKLSNHYKKAVKKGQIDEETAKQELISAIEVCLFIRFQQTSEFEDKLRELKSTDDIAALYTKKVKIQY